MVKYILIYLSEKRRVQLPPVFRLRCPICGYEDVYSKGNAVEEDIYTFTCPVCKLRFFITSKPPLIAECPHCSSILSITSLHEEPEVIRANPRTHSLTVTTTMLLGALLSALSSRYRLGGAIAGGLIGALIGMFIDASSEPEAKYIDGY